MIEIVLLKEDGGEVFGPIVSCDVCCERVEGPANVLFPLFANRDAPRTPPPPPAYVHKGRCTAVGESRIRLYGYYPGWQELSDFVRYLSTNTTEAIGSAGVARAEIKPEVDDDDLVGIRRAASLLGVSTTSLSLWIDRGFIPHRIIEGRAYVTGADIRGFSVPQSQGSRRLGYPAFRPRDRPAEPA